MLEEKVCFTDMNEDLEMSKQNNDKDDMLKSKEVVQGHILTGDQLFMDEAVSKKYMLDKKLFIN